MSASPWSAGRPAPRGHDLPTWSRWSALLDEAQCHVLVAENRCLLTARPRWGRIRLKLSPRPSEEGTKAAAWYLWLWCRLGQGVLGPRVNPVKETDRLGRTGQRPAADLSPRRPETVTAVHVIVVPHRSGQGSRHGYDGEELTAALCDGDRAVRQAGEGLLWRYPATRREGKGPRELAQVIWIIAPTTCLSHDLPWAEQPIDGTLPRAEAQQVRTELRWKHHTEGRFELVKFIGGNWQHPPVMPIGAEDVA